MSAALLLTVAVAAANPTVEITTNHGVIELELDQDKAPKSVENFLAYAKAGTYDGTVFHRVIKNFMIQDGGFTPELKKQSTRAPIVNESSNGLSNTRGTIAMARTNDPNSATNQFFINVVDNRFLDNRPGRPGYAVFGKVTKGMDVVDKIKAVPTGACGQFRKDCPTTAVVIKSVKVTKAATAAPAKPKK